MNTPEILTVTERVTVVIPGLKQPRTFLHISDCHVTHAYPTDSDETAALAEKQANVWNQSGILPVDALHGVLAYAEQTKPDAILMAGDIIDYYSDSNAAYIRELLSAQSTECLYVWGNHEHGTYGPAVPPMEEMRASLAPLMLQSPTFWVRDFGEFLIVGVDDGSYRFTEDQLTRMKEVIACGKPILLLLHLPIRSEVLSPYCEKSWWGCDVTLGGSFHGTDETTEAFLSLVTAEDSPVEAIFAGHLHYSHAGEFAPGRMQYVSAPCFNRYVREVCITGR